MADATPEEKLATANQEIDRLKAELARKDDGKPVAADAEDLTPTPTQAEVDALKSGASLTGDKAGTYKTRQAKA